MVIVNGTEEQHVAGQSITAFLTARDAPIDNVVVELNGEIIHRPQFDDTQLNENDKVELISFVGGGR
ncbi:thiamine biosynthesis protein ThiS [Secundilactobacillus paracollinoides]|uniref:Thiamine biosynthesis protein ThiS n=1 Tax=Secundilactobacillus paracollinoides TaxID=240427 RepID=A0A1B2IVX4_9LACO|nr:sulfur carrier protein ThiS [Secundilactobacillus paracollinoides]ANZ60363.1 thiamine biosynthesis protein ThiS [Secundilactobacillus paracollinoides]ANZ62648.1 thiamine biosynthesis protein ThiS [Secundilactobacillus paracollinoides]ANZ66192.1 thiamine biosynthesis protein ThiS [Secundilactobacillus paracollinoides]KRL75065.1 hypothetical protein FC17_GL002961 [Secundilactobacillus paracollinoides DSM 15502 = JCM 11969]